MAKKTETPAPGEDTVVVELHGERFSWPADQDDWPTGAIVAAGRVASGRATYDDVVASLLGEEQWARLAKMPFRHFKEFLQLFSAAMERHNS